MKRTTILMLSLLLATSVIPVLAQATSEARGKVLDQDGNPVVGAVVKFFAASNPTLIYSGKTNKKGRYFVPGLFTGKERDTWTVDIEVEGMIPVQMVVASRTANRSLVGDIRTIKVKPNQKVSGFIIPPLGSAEVDMTLAPPEAIAEEPNIVVNEEGQRQVVTQRVDPWAAALTHAQDGDLMTAEPFFIEAIEEEPEDPERYKAYAQVLYQMKRYDDAETQANKTIELAPDDINAYMVLYSASVGKGDMAQAQTALDRAKSIDPDNLDVLRQVAFVAGESGTPEEQIAANVAITEVAPDDPQAWLSLGDLYARQGDMAKSEQAYQRVVELDPENAHMVFFNLGALIIKNDNRTEEDTRKAIGAFRKAVEINPSYARAYRELAFALLGVGDRAGAREALEQYVEVAPDAPDAKQMEALIKSLPEA